MDWSTGVVWIIVISQSEACFTYTPSAVRMQSMCVMYALQMQHGLIVLSHRMRLQSAPTQPLCVTGTCQLMIMRKLHRSLRQVHFKRLHNGTHVPCSLQSLHSNGIGMITYIWNLSENRTVPIRVPSHP